MCRTVKPFRVRIFRGPAPFRACVGRWALRVLGVAWLREPWAFPSPAVTPALLSSLGPSINRSVHYQLLGSESLEARGEQSASRGADFGAVQREEGRHGHAFGEASERRGQ